MLAKEELQTKIREGAHILDGATGSNLMKAGMPRDCSVELWVLEHPDAILDLQRRYYEAGSRIVYAPTFQAQPAAFAKYGLDGETEKLNARLIALSRQAAPGALIAGDMTTLAAFMETWDEDNYDDMVANYRRQIRGLADGGADLLIGETLIYLTEAEAILEAAQAENAGAVMLSFSMQPDGRLFSGRPAADALRRLEQAGAAAVGFNCVAASEELPGLVSLLRRQVKGPLICKPNAGLPVMDAGGNTRYSLAPAPFGQIMAQCKAMGADLLGGCCGTDPDYISAISGL
ncbi:MAG: homocysteine S-methyltransferase family protein [Firmicutes bacterium]|nr:homocysteine S-methyltransferase family protein [Bacillota bacterium]